MRRAILAASLAVLAYACQRDFSERKRHAHNHQRRQQSITKRQAEFPPVLTEAETLLVNSFDNNTIEDWSYYYTHQNKLAGLGREAAEWTAERWREHGFEAFLEEFQVYLSYPVSSSLHIAYANGTRAEVSLVEDVLPEDDVTGRADNQPTFHGYSASGNVTAEYIYAGRGTFADFEHLVKLGVDLEGKIALMKYGGLFRGLKVKNAQDHGCVGAIIFTDPGDDGNTIVENGFKAYPDGPARNPSSVQKGSVLFLSTRPGDPTTPGYASHADSPRAAIDDVTPSIPSVPLSFAAVLPLLQALNGTGLSAEEVNRTNWLGGLEAEYRTGPAPGVQLTLYNEQEPQIQPIWNVIGYINGTVEDETVIVGNHRDTWMVGGAGDPNSGSAILVEFTKAIGKLVETGWKPKRTLVVASWDAEEWGLVGSTEFMEDRTNWLVENALAYLNIDVAVSGPHPDLSATPELHKIATEVAAKVIAPVGGAFNRSLFDVWEEESEGTVGVLGSGSDYTAFLHRGISSLDMGSGNGANDPVWHYHSNYDTYHWMSTFGDPGFHTHAAMGQWLTLLAYRLVSDAIVPFDVQNYAVELRSYYDELIEYAASANATLDFAELSEAIEEFAARANELKALEQLAAESGEEELVRVVNHKYRDFQRGFVSQGGLPDREFYRHVVMAPGLDTGYAAVTFAGITEGIQYERLEDAEEWVGKTARGILRAADIIKT